MSLETKRSLPVNTTKEHSFFETTSTEIWNGFRILLANREILRLLAKHTISSVTEMYQKSMPLSGSWCFVSTQISRCSFSVHTSKVNVGLHLQTARACWSFWRPSSKWPISELLGLPFPKKNCRHVLPKNKRQIVRQSFWSICKYCRMSSAKRRLPAHKMSASLGRCSSKSGKWRWQQRWHEQRNYIRLCRNDVAKNPNGKLNAIQMGGKKINRLSKKKKCKNSFESNLTFWTNESTHWQQKNDPWRGYHLSGLVRLSLQRMKSHNWTQLVTTTNCQRKPKNLSPDVQDAFNEEHSPTQHAHGASSVLCD